MLDEHSRDAPVLEITDYLAILRRRRFTILIVTLIVLGAGIYRSTHQEKAYRAEGQIVVQSDTNFTGAAATEARIIESPAVHAVAVKNMPTATSVSASVDPTDTVISVTAESGSPRNAARTVNAHMNAYLEYTQQTQSTRYQRAVAAFAQPIQALQTQIDQLTPTALLNPTGVDATRRNNLLSQQFALNDKLQSLQIDASLAGQDVSIVARATPPSSPFRPKPLQDALIALGAGLLLGIALAFLVEFLDESIKTRDDLQRATGSDVPVLAMIPKTRSLGTDVVSISRPESIAAEAYRALRTAVYFVGLDQGGRFEVTSPNVRDGKTSTSTNLAITAARSGRRVVLVDCDLRRPSVHRLLNLPNEAGLTSVLLGAEPQDVWQTVPGIDNLSVLTSGPLPPNPSEVLGSDRCREVLQSLQADGALVVIDTSPLLPVTDAVALASTVDAVILVARARHSTRRQVRQAVGLLRQTGAPLVGTVLNGAKEDTADIYYGSYVPSRRRQRRRSRGKVPSAPIGIPQPAARRDVGGTG